MIVPLPIPNLEGNSRTTAVTEVTREQRQQQQQKQMKTTTMTSSSSSPSPSSSPSGPAVPFGSPMRHAHFAFSPNYTPLNHGSYGAHPVSVRGVHAALQSEAEGAPDRFIVLDWAARLHPQRALVAGLLGCRDTDDIVFTPNATTAIDCVLKNLRWEKGDVILCYGLVYEGVRGGLAWLEEKFGVTVEVVDIAFPISDDALVRALVAAAREVKSRGDRLRLAVVDTIISTPGIRVPFERLVPALQAEGALVLVDGAHGVGHIPIDLAALKPDFFVTNLHKWLFVPRGATALYVARDLQGLIRSSLPTSVRFRREGWEEDENAFSFVQLFDFVATLDMTNFLTVQAALDFRTNVCGGEATIQKYCFDVARESGDAAAAILGTHVMDIEGSRMRECNFANVRLPLEIAGSDSKPSSGGPGNWKIDAHHVKKVCPWIKARGVAESGCYFQVFVYRGEFWWRVSGMVYVEVDDFRRGAVVLKELCQRVREGEFLTV